MQNGFIHIGFLEITQNITIKYIPITDIFIQTTHTMTTTTPFQSKYGPTNKQGASNVTTRRRLFATPSRSLNWRLRLPLARCIIHCSLIGEANLTSIVYEISLGVCYGIGL